MNEAQFYKLIDKYENIIFDYGGVLIDIDYQKTVQALNKLSPLNLASELYSKKYQSEIFNLLETGNISEDNFILKLSLLLQIPQSQFQLVHDAWCAMLLDLKLERLNLLRQISKDKRIFILSNINIIHENFMLKYIEEHPQFTIFYSLFEKVYFSHNLNLRKPDPKIFEFVLKDSNLDINKTLFIDDSEQHISSAKSLGLGTHLLESNTLLMPRS